MLTGRVIPFATLLAILSFTGAALAAPHGSKSTKPIPLTLSSDAALIVDQGTGKTLFIKNANEKKSIASITKLMTAMIVLDSKQSLDSKLYIRREDVDMQRGSTSRLHIGTALTRREMLKLALMSSANRAAFALARNHPGGTVSFVAAMNRKAAALGMKNTVFYDPTGLDARNISTAKDLSLMVNAAHRYGMIRKMTTATSHRIVNHTRKITFRNTNRLVRNKNWNIGLSKTGYISDSGKCLVMQTTIAKRPTIVVLLDSWGRHSRIADAIRVKSWLERGMRHGSAHNRWH